MTTSTLTKTNTEYVKDLFSSRFYEDMTDLIDRESEHLDSLNPDKIYTKYVGTEESCGYDLWYKIGRRYVKIYSASSYYGWTYGNPKNSFEKHFYSFQLFPTDKDGYSIPMCREHLTKKDVAGYGCSPKKLIK